MKRAVIALTAGALAVGTAAVPNRADAIAEWVVPAIIASGFGGTVFGLGAATTAERNAQYRANAPVAYLSRAGRHRPGCHSPGRRLRGAGPVLLDHQGAKARRQAHRRESLRPAVSRSSRASKLTKGPRGGEPPSWASSLGRLRPEPRILRIVRALGDDRGAAALAEDLDVQLRADLAVFRPHHGERQRLADPPAVAADWCSGRRARRPSRSAPSRAHRRR